MSGIIKMALTDNALEMPSNEDIVYFSERFEHNIDTIDFDVLFYNFPAIHEYIINYPNVVNLNIAKMPIVQCVIQYYDTDTRMFSIIQQFMNIFDNIYSSHYIEFVEFATSVGGFDYLIKMSLNTLQENLPVQDDLGDVFIRLNKIKTRDEDENCRIDDI
jgi:hypothetical protein